MVMYPTVIQRPNDNSGLKYILLDNKGRFTQLYSWKNILWSRNLGSCKGHTKFEFVSSEIIDLPRDKIALVTL